MLYVLLLQQVRDALRFFNGRGAHQHRPAFHRDLLDLVRHGVIFFFFRTIYHVRILFAQQRAVGGNHHHLQLINLVELRCFCLGCSGHAGQLFIQAKIILEGDGRQRLRFALNLHAFFGFNRLMQTVRPAPSRHQASGELVNDQDFAVLHHVLNIFAVHGMGFHRGFNVVLHRPVFRIGNILDPQQAFHLVPALVGDHRVLMLLVHDEVTGIFLRLSRRFLNLLAFYQVRHNAVRLFVFIGGLIALPADDQWRSGFVNQDGINFVHDSEIVSALYALS